MDNIDGGTEIERIRSSITDELREYANGWRDRSCYERLLAIADRIDEQHRRALERVAAMVDEPDETERRIKALEHLTEGMLLVESEFEGRISMLERKLSHKTGKLAGNDFGAVFLDELGQEEQGGADVLADD